MKARFINRLWIAVPIVFMSVIAKADTSSNTIIAASESLDKTLLELRAQGFKTDLTNFDFFTPPEARARQRILEATVPDQRTGVFRDYPDLMEPAGSNQVIVIWEQAALRRQRRRGRTPVTNSAGRILVMQSIRINRKSMPPAGPYFLAPSNLI